VAAKTPGEGSRTAASRGFVLDTSAIISFVSDEAGADEVQQILEGDEPVALPFIVLMEVRYILLRRLPPSDIDRLFVLLTSGSADIPESDPLWGRKAADIKAGGGLSMADSWIAALALRSGAQLVHKDKEFDRVAGLRSQRLPQ
jgi:predicted nucleic acid-binding protein